MAGWSGRAYPRLELLHECCHLGHATLFVGLHLLVDFLLRYLAEVAALLKGLLEDLLLVLSFLGKLFLHFNPLALENFQKETFHSE